VIPKPARVVMDDEVAVNVGRGVVPGGYDASVFGLRRVPRRRDVGVRTLDDDECSPCPPNTLRISAARSPVPQVWDLGAGGPGVVRRGSFTRLILSEFMIDDCQHLLACEVAVIVECLEQLVQDLPDAVS
jgi:hypothetical protein